MSLFKRGPENLQKVNFDCVEFGGATLSSNLLNLPYYRNGYMIVDPLINKITKPLMRLMQSGQFGMIPGFLNGSNEFDTIPPEKLDRVSMYYQFLAQNLGTKIESVSLVNDRLERTHTTTNKVICFFPHPMLMPPSEVINSAFNILVEGGNLEIITENVDWLQTALEYLEDQRIKGESKVIGGLDLPLSVYDVFYEKNPYKFSLNVQK